MVVAGRIEAGGNFVRYLAPEFPLLEVVYVTPGPQRIGRPRAVRTAAPPHCVGYAGGSVRVHDISEPHRLVPAPLRPSYSPPPPAREPWEAPAREPRRQYTHSPGAPSCAVRVAGGYKLRDPDTDEADLGAFYGRGATGEQQLGARYATHHARSFDRDPRYFDPASIHHRHRRGSEYGPAPFGNFLGEHRRYNKFAAADNWPGTELGSDALTDSIAGGAPGATPVTLEPPRTIWSSEPSWG